MSLQEDPRYHGNYLESEHHALPSRRHTYISPTLEGLTAMITTAPLGAVRDAPVEHQEPGFCNECL